MLSDKLSFNTSNTSLNALQNDHNAQSSKGSFSSRIVTNTTNTVQAGLQQLGSALRGLPNPVHFLASSPGRLITTALLVSSNFVDARSLPNASNSDITALPTGMKANEWYNAYQYNNDSKMLDLLPNDLSSELTEDLLSPPEDEYDNDESQGVSREKRSEWRKPKGKWTDVPYVKDHDQPLRADQLTQDGEFARVGIPTDRNVKQSRSKKDGSITYRFHLGDYRDNKLSRGGQPGATPCPPPKSGTGTCKGRAELTQCFFKVGEQPPYTKATTAFLKESKAYLNECPKGIPMGDVFSIDMDVQIETLGESIITQIHGKPDRWLYWSKAGNGTFVLSPESSAEAYRQLVKDGMIFEQGGYPPLSMSIEEHKNNHMLILKTRSEYVALNKKGNRCNMNYSKMKTGNSQAKCCDGERDVSILFSQPIGNRSNELDMVSKWTNIKFEIKTSDYKGYNATLGYVKMWVNDQMTTNAVGYLGANDAPERGGGNLYGKFGLYRTKSEQPITMRFKNVKMQKGALNPVPPEQLNATKISGQCSPALKPYCVT